MRFWKRRNFFLYRRAEATIGKQRCRFERVYSRFISATVRKIAPLWQKIGPLDRNNLSSRMPVLECRAIVPRTYRTFVANHVRRETSSTCRSAGQFYARLGSARPCYSTQIKLGWRENIRRLDKRAIKFIFLIKKITREVVIPCWKDTVSWYSRSSRWFPMR